MATIRFGDHPEIKNNNHVLAKAHRTTFEILFDECLPKEENFFETAKAIAATFQSRVRTS